MLHPTDTIDIESLESWVLYQIFNHLVMLQSVTFVSLWIKYNTDLIVNLVIRVSNSEERVSPVLIILEGYVIPTNSNVRIS